MMPSDSWTHEQIYFLALWRTLTRTNVRISIDRPIMSLMELFDYYLEYLNWNTKRADSHLTDIANEIVEFLNNTKILSNDTFTNDEQDFRSIMSHQISNDEDRNNRKNIIRHLKNKIVKFPIGKLYLDAIGELYHSKPRFHQIDALVSHWITELLYQGYSLQYMHEWAVDTPIGSVTFAELLNDIDTKFCSSTQKTTFDIYIRFEALTNGIDITTYRQTLKLFNPSNWENSEHKDFFSDGFTYALVKTTALDKFQAIEDAIQLVLQFLRDLLLIKPDDKYRGEIYDDVIIVKPEGVVEKITRIHQKTSRKVANVEHLIKIANLNQDKNVNKETYQKLTQVLYWITKGTVDSPEVSLVQIWTAVESLFESVRDHSNKDIVQIVAEYLYYFIGLFYMRRYTEEIYPELRQLLRIPINESMKEIAVAQPISLDLDRLAINIEKMSLIDVAKIIYDYGDTLISASEKNHLLRRMLFDYMSLVKGDGKLYLRLHDLRNFIHKEVKQIYRYRNNFVHRAHVGNMHLQHVLNRLFFYLQAMMNNLIYYYQINPTSSLDELLTVTARTYKNFESKLENTTPNSIEQVVNIYPLYLQKISK